MTTWTFSLLACILVEKKAESDLLFKEEWKSYIA